MSINNLNTANKLMLLQGISLIENGLQFLDWIDEHANLVSYDALIILKNRFQFFKENTLFEGKYDNMFISRAKSNLENVQYGYELNQKLKRELEDLRKVVILEYKENKGS